MKVVVTRAAAQADTLVGRLEARGHEVVRCPLIRVEPLGDEPLDLSRYDWVVVTSPNGAGELARRLVEAPRHFAAIGPATAEALRGLGYEPDLVARVHTQEGLRDELPPGRTLLAAAEGARQGVIEGDFLRMTFPVMCLQNGSLGQLVRVLNKETKKTYLAHVTGLGVVTSVLPD